MNIKELELIRSAFVRGVDWGIRTYVGTNAVVTERDAMTVALTQYPKLPRLRVVEWTSRSNTYGARAVEDANKEIIPHVYAMYINGHIAHGTFALAVVLTYCPIEYVPTLAKQLLDLSDNPYTF